MKTENPREWLNPKPTKPHHDELPDGQEFPKECQGRHCNSFRISSVPDGLGGNGRIHTNGRGFADVHCFDKAGVFLGALCQKCYDQNLYAAGMGRFSELCGWDGATRSFELTAESAASWVPAKKVKPSQAQIYPGNSEDRSAGHFATLAVSEIDALADRLAEDDEDWMQ